MRNSINDFLDGIERDSFGRPMQAQKAGKQKLIALGMVLDDKPVHGSVSIFPPLKPRR
jgi:hypothetical protein